MTDVMLKFTGNYINVYFSGVSKNFTINWGDGTSSSGTTSGTGSATGIGHTYTYSGKYIITIQGEATFTRTSPSLSNISGGERKKIILTYEIMKKLYPIGSIYMSVNSTNPGTRFYGGWEQIKDKFLLGCGDTYTNGSTGGEATHTLTEAELPVHSHVQNNTPNIVANRIAPSGSYRIADVQTTTYTEYTGGGQAHNNMPPYLTVYMWRRVV